MKVSKSIRIRRYHFSIRQTQFAIKTQCQDTKINCSLHKQNVKGLWEIRKKISCFFFSPRRNTTLVHLLWLVVKLSPVNGLNEVELHYQTGPMDKRRTVPDFFFQISFNYRILSFRDSFKQAYCKTSCAGSRKVLCVNIEPSSSSS